jgi:polysaccharide transporter, PST family
MSVFTKKKLKDFFTYGIGQLINIVSPLFVMPFLIYRCGENGFGKVGVGFSCALILSGIIDYGSYINGVKEISINRENRNILENKFTAIYFSKFILILLVFCLFSLLILFVPFFAKDKPLFFFSFLIVVGQFINPQWFFQGTENFKWISIVNIISKLIYISLIILLIKKESDYIYANLFFGIGAIIGNGIGVYWLLKKYSFSFSNSSLSDAFFILKNEFTFSISQIFLSVYQFFPIIIISYIGGDFMAGQFRIVDQLVSLFKTYLNMFFYFVYANICFELTKSFKKGITAWKQYNGSNFILISILTAIFYIYSELIISLLVKDNGNIALISEYLRIGLVIPLMIAVSQPLRQLMFAFNENKIYIRITIITTIINLIMLYVLSTIHGLIGAFVSIIIIEFIIIVLYLTILKKHFRENAMITNE